jgi:hypothetical protein
MRRGVWHQFGDRSQKIVLEQLGRGAGVGVIFSPRDISQALAIKYAQQYLDFNVDILIDQQFYEPTFTNEHLKSFSINEFRTSVSELRQIADPQLKGVAHSLEEVHRRLHATGVIAPALGYEAGRPDIVEVNSRLFSAAKTVGDAIGIPTYASVVLGPSAIANTDTVNSALSYATSLPADGWYFAFEFEADRLPVDRSAVYRCLAAGIKLACTGRPVLHAYAGPMAPISFEFGATGAAIGHSQKLWKFTRERWQAPSEQGGGGDSPPRFWSTALWGTIVYPDETVQLTTALRRTVLTRSPYSAPVESGLAWPKWDSNKHLLHVIGEQTAQCAGLGTAREIAVGVRDRLRAAVTLHKTILNHGIALRDRTAAYQMAWSVAVDTLLQEHGDDFDFIELIG